MKVIVGPEGDQKLFMLHEGVLCYYSPYFQGALNGGFKEATTREVIIDDIKPKIMEALSSWMYFHKLYDPKDPTSVKHDSPVKEDRTAVSLELPDLVELWLFGDRMGVSTFQNAAIDAIHQREVDTALYGLNDHIKIIYARTTQGAKLRAYAIECLIRLFKDKAVQLDQRFQVMEFYTELSNRLMKIRKEALNLGDKAYWRSLDMCQFHNHKDKDCKGRAVTEESGKQEQQTRRRE